jgi:hypothetical protein
MLRLLELNDMDQVAIVQRRSRDRALPWIKMTNRMSRAGTLSTSDTSDRTPRHSPDYFCS